jgi:hypothetical protein
MLMRFPRHFSQAVEQAKALEQRRKDRGIEVDRQKQEEVLQFANLKEYSLLQRLGMQKTFFKRKRSRKEKVYIAMVLMVLPWIPCRKTGPDCVC